MTLFSRLNLLIITFLQKTNTFQFEFVELSNGRDDICILEVALSPCTDPDKFSRKVHIRSMFVEEGGFSCLNSTTYTRVRNLLDHHFRVKISQKLLTETNSLNVYFRMDFQDGILFTGKVR